MAKDIPTRQPKMLD